MSICIQNKSFYPDIPFPKCPRDLENLLREIHSCGICSGGPEFANTGYTKSSVAVQDVDTKRWRHKNCPVFRLNTEDGLCPKCHSLYRIFDKLTTNNSRSKKGTSLKNASPKTVIRSMKRQLSRVNLQLREAQRQLEECKKVIGSKDYNDVMELVNEQGLPEVQVPSSTIFIKFFNGIYNS